MDMMLQRLVMEILHEDRRNRATIDDRSVKSKLPAALYDSQRMCLMILAPLSYILFW